MKRTLRPRRKLEAKHKLVIVLIVLVLLLDALYLISSYQKKKAETEPTVTDSTVDLSVQNLDAVTGITWDYGGDVFSLSREDGVWYNAQDDAFPVKQSLADQMLQALGNITSTQVITDVYDYAQYGLESPTMTLTVSLGNGSSDLTIGNQNPLTEDYYIRIDTSKNTVYTISADLIKAFSYGKNDLLQMETLPSFGTAVSIDVENENGSFTAVRDLTKDDENAVWSLETGTALDSAKVEELVNYAIGTSWLSCVTYSATNQDLNDYGLKDPAAIVTLTDENDVSFTLCIGYDAQDVPVKTDGFFGTTTSEDAERPEGTFARFPGSNMIYLIGTDTAEQFKTVSAAALQ